MGVDVLMATNEPSGGSADNCHAFIHALALTRTMTFTGVTHEALHYVKTKEILVNL